MMKLSNMKNGLMIAMATVCVIGVCCMAFVFGYMYHSYRWAVVGLEMCEMDGMAECHLEREGLEFNVYGKGEMK